MPPVAKPAPKPADKKKRRKKKKKLVMRQLKLKGLWLKTPEDWAQFKEWAKKNAVPREYPPPEPINRGPKRRLAKLKKRIKSLSQPRRLGPPEECLPLPRPISALALKAVASRRTKRLARPVIRFVEGCHQWKVKRSALLYEATDTILLLSLPRFREDPDDCRELGVVSPAAIRRTPTDKDCELAQPKQRADGDDCAEKVIECDDSDLSPWVDFLAIPNYRVLKEMHNVHLADKYKKRFMSEKDERPKQAYKEQLRKRQRKRERDKRKKAAKKKKVAEEKRKEESMKTKSKSSLGESRTDVTSENEIEDETSEAAESSFEETEPPPEEAEQEEEENNEEGDDECMKKRKKEKETWRYVTVGCKKFPPEIPMSALNYEATDEIIALAIPKVYKKDLCKDPYKISEEAKNAVASPRVEELAKPKHQCDPVKRAEPREKDEWGRPIFPPREYGKKLPKPKPYKTRECPKKKEEGEGEEGDDEDSFEDEFETFDHEDEPSTAATESSPDKSGKMRKKRKKSRPIDPIASEPTIDPLFDPIGARKQLKERERAKKLEEEEAEKKKAESAKEGEEEDSKDAEQP